MQSEYIHTYIYILGRLYLDHRFASLDMYLYMHALLLSYSAVRSKYEYKWKLAVLSDEKDHDSHLTYPNEEE